MFNRKNSQVRGLPPAVQKKDILEDGNKKQKNSIAR